MEKMVWAKPEMNEMVFAANEYVSLCLKLTCTLMGDYDWVDMNEGNSKDPEYHNGNVNWGQHMNDMTDIHQANQCGLPGWFNNTTKQESGTNEATIQNVWLDKNGNGTYGDDGDIFADTAEDDVLRQVTTSLGAIWQSVLNNNVWNHRGTAVFEAKNANNS